MKSSDQEKERLEILRRYRRLIEVWHTRKDTLDRWMVRKAFRVAADAHKDMRRKTGEPFTIRNFDGVVKSLLWATSSRIRLFTSSSSLDQKIVQNYDMLSS